MLFNVPGPAPPSSSLPQLLIFHGSPLPTGQSLCGVSLAPEALNLAPAHTAPPHALWSEISLPLAQTYIEASLPAWFSSIL